MQSYIKRKKTKNKNRLLIRNNAIQKTVQLYLYNTGGGWGRTVNLEFYNQ